MKQTTLYLLALVALSAALSIWLISKNRKATLRKELRDFAVSDTASITRIFLADRNNQKILLERKSPAEWILNGTEKARQGGINQLLATLRNVAVRTRVAKSYYNLTLKDLASTGIKCEIYLNHSDTPQKVYYVGGSTQDILGTFMMLEKSSVPFITEIPGFNGYLTPRYSTRLNDWRDRTVFAIHPSEIQSISITYPPSPEKSFRIDLANGRYTVSSADGSKKIAQPDSVGLANYLGFFNQLPFEDWDKEFDEPQRDSLKASTPLARITLTSVSGTTAEAVLYHKPVTLRSLSQLDEKGNALQYDRDRMYASIKQGMELVVIQYYSFGKVLRQLNDFDLTAKKRNGR